MCSYYKWDKGTWFVVHWVPTKQKEINYDDNNSLDTLVSFLINFPSLLLPFAVTLKNAAEVLEFAALYNAEQLKLSCLQFMVLNMAALLESKWAWKWLSPCSTWKVFCFLIVCKADKFLACWLFSRKYTSIFIEVSPVCIYQNIEHQMLICSLYLQRITNMYLNVVCFFLHPLFFSLTFLC